MVKRGREAKHYRASSAKNIVGMRRDAKSGRYFPVGRGKPLFGTNEAKAIQRFYRWQAKQRHQAEPDIPVKMPSTIGALDALVEGRVPEWRWRAGQFESQVEPLKAA